MKQEYDSAAMPAQAPAAGDDFASQYDQAAAAAGQEQQEAPAPEEQAAPLDIPPADVTKMQGLKDSGDMQGLGSYVAQFLK